MRQAASRKWLIDISVLTKPDLGLRLKKPSIDDRDIFAPYLNANKYGVCDFSFSNIFIWRHTYHVDYAIYKGCLVILSSDFDGIRHFFIPLSLDGGDVKEVICDLIAWSRERGQDFRMIGLTDKMLEELAFLGPDFEVPPYDVWDYIYLTEDLISLKGKKFQGKRNHINKFNATYSYEYKILERGHIPLCAELLDSWYEAHDGTAYLMAEKRAVNEALANFDKLGLIGGCLFVEGKLGAFALGQPLNGKIYAIHVEKALIRYDGIYSKINQLYAENHCAGFKYINREEDLGIEGLRKAKMSYNPAYLLHKRIGVLPYECM